MYAAMDLAIDRMKRSAAEYHERHTNGRPHHAQRPAAPVEADESEEEDVEATV